MIGWLIDQLIDWLIDWLISWIISGFFFFQPSSDLFELIQILCLVFGDDPPVFSKLPGPPSRPPPPNLRGQQHFQDMPYPNSQPTSMPMPNSQLGGFNPPTSMPYPNTNSLPPYPASQGGLPPYPMHSFPPTSNFPVSSSQQQQQQPALPPYSRTPPSYPPAQSTSTVQRDGDTQNFQPRNPPVRQGSVVDPKVLKMSMLSSVEHKLKKRVNEVFEQGKVSRIIYFYIRANSSFKA